MNKRRIRISLIWGLLMFFIHMIFTNIGFSLKYLASFLFISFIIIITIEMLMKFIKEMFKDLFLK